MGLDCSVEVDGTVVTVTAAGDIGFEATAEVRGLLQTALAQPGITAVILDLNGVTFLDSSALGVLVAARKSADQHGTQFGLARPGPMVTMVLQITGLYDELVVSSVEAFTATT